MALQDIALGYRNEAPKRILQWMCFLTQMQWKPEQMTDCFNTIILPINVDQW
jgi:hypothetical protein